MAIGTPICKMPQPMATKYAEEAAAALAALQQQMLAKKKSEEKSEELPMATVTATNNLSQIMSDIDLGPTGSVQMMFAKLQLGQSMLCKNQAESYMKQIQDIQTEQKLCSEMIARARALQGQAADKKGDTDIPLDMRNFFTARGLIWDPANYCVLSKDKWDYALKSLTNYQEQVGNKTQSLMVYVQDFIGQYNSYLQGANTAISNANQVLTNIARGQ